MLTTRVAAAGAAAGVVWDGRESNANSTQLGNGAQVAVPAGWQVPSLERSLTLAPQPPMQLLEWALLSPVCNTISLFVRKEGLNGLPA